jgi:hypothetical protein
MLKIASIFILLVSSIALNGQDLYTFENSARFADYLMQAGRYSMAAAEFERLVFLKPDSLRLKTNLLDSYALDRNFEAIMRRAMQFQKQNAFEDTLFTNYRIWSLLKQDNRPINTIQFSNTETISETAKKYYWAWQELMNQQVLKAQENIPKNALYIPEVALLDETCTKAASLRLKNKALAACMSAIVPGSGKWYAGERKDAVIGFVTIGMMAYQAYRGFRKDGTSSVYGWISAGLGAGFYVGNIYGSARSAKRYNDRKFKTLQPDFESNFKRFPCATP